MGNLLPVGRRLREERERLGLNQDAFGAIGGAKRKSQYNYENGISPPDAEYLLQIAEIGADVAYILFGIRTNATAEMPAEYNALRKDQIALLDNLEHCSKEDQDAIKRMAFLAAHAAEINETESGQKKA